MKIFLLVLAFAISFLDADAAIEYCCVKKSVRKIFGGKSDCTPHHTETASSAKCAKGNIIVKEFVESSRELASHVLVPALNDVMNRFVCHKSTVVVRRQVR